MNKERFSRWLGDSIGELLEGTDATEALQRPLADRHTIWEIVLHLNAWYREAHLRVIGEPAGDLSPNEDWPSVGGANAASWQAVRRELAHNHEQLRQAVLRLDESRLDDDVEGAGYSIYFLLHGVIQHSLYHAGQIAILKAV